MRKEHYLYASSPVMEAELEGYKVCCLVDTGSECTLMPLEFFERHFGHMMEPEDGSVIRLTAANNREMDVLGIVWLWVRLFGQDVGKKGVVLVDRSSRRGMDVTLGMNVLRDLDHQLYAKEGPKYWQRATTHQPTQKVLQQMLRSCSLQKNNMSGQPIEHVRVPRRTPVKVPPREEQILILPVGEG